MVLFLAGLEMDCQMMPFQMYLYEHLRSFSSLYDASFGLGGDYMKGLSYYYSLSPLMWLNFLFIKTGETVGIFIDDNTFLADKPTYYGYDTSYHNIFCRDLLLI